MVIIGVTCNIAGSQPGSGKTEESLGTELIRTVRKLYNSGRFDLASVPSSQHIEKYKNYSLGITHTHTRSDGASIKLFPLVFSSSALRSEARQSAVRIKPPALHPSEPEPVTVCSQREN